MPDVPKEISDAVDLAEYVRRIQEKAWDEGRAAGNELRWVENPFSHAAIARRAEREQHQG